MEGLIFGIVWYIYSSTSSLLSNSPQKQIKSQYKRWRPALFINRFQNCTVIIYFFVSILAKRSMLSFLSFDLYVTRQHKMTTFDSTRCGSLCFKKKIGKIGQPHPSTPASLILFSDFEIFLKNANVDVGSHQKMRVLTDFNPQSKQSSTNSAVMRPAPLRQLSNKKGFSNLDNSSNSYVRGRQMQLFQTTIVDVSHQFVFF